jgi:hypothetical protein
MTDSVKYVVALPNGRYEYGHWKLEHLVGGQYDKKKVRKGDAHSLEVAMKHNRMTTL